VRPNQIHKWCRQLPEDAPYLSIQSRVP
jgi:hypothetical protein